MKPIQIMMDEKLLEDLDATEAVRAEGRSAVLRKAVEQYLAAQRKLEIRERYRAAYGSPAGLGPEYVGWEEQGTWPDE